MTDDKKFKLPGSVDEAMDNLRNLRERHEAHSGRYFCADLAVESMSLADRCAYRGQVDDLRKHMAEAREQLGERAPTHIILGQDEVVAAWKSAVILYNERVEAYRNLGIEQTPIDISELF